MDRDLFLSTESEETLSYLETRSRATRSTEEAQIEKKVGEESEDGRRVGEKRREQLEDSSEEYHGTFAFMCYLLVWEKYCPTNQLWLRNCSLVRRPRRHLVVVDRPTFISQSNLVLHDKPIHNVKPGPSHLAVI